MIGNTSLTAILCTVAAIVLGALPGIGTRAEADPVQPRHSQEEAIRSGPLPYRSEEVRFTNERAEVTLAGTLSVPIGKAPFPAVFLIAAAGPEGRDEEVAGHRVFVVLADHLLRQGIAVLRYDKRGTGASTGDWAKASFDDLVSDAATALDYLKRRAEVDPHRVGLIGHSEGGSIAPAVAIADTDVAFVVALAGSGLSGPVRVTEQQVYFAQENGASSKQQAAVRALCQQIFRTVASTADDVAAGTRIAALIDRAIALKTLNPQIASAIRQRLTPAFVREELTDDPVKYLYHLQVPMLALVGSLDRIVPADLYVQAMQPILAGIPGSKVQVLPGLNHVMQTARTGSPREFGTIAETISPVALAVIGDWVVKQTQRSPP
jgi:uncharacterized protein